VGNVAWKLDEKLAGKVVWSEEETEAWRLDKRLAESVGVRGALRRGGRGVWTGEAAARISSQICLLQDSIQGMNNTVCYHCLTPFCFVQSESFPALHCFHC